ncbi:MAG: CDP-glycerol glycerophosphotransferase family protein [Candidatus Aphodocola sp.]
MEEDMKKLNITFCSFPDFAGNAKALYEYMVKRYKDNMNYTWIVYNESTVEILKEKGIKAILIGTDEFKKYVPKTNVFFTTQGNLDGDKIKAKNSVYIELWHGIGPKPVGFAQENPSNEDLRGYGNISEIVDYFIVPSEFWKIVWGAIFKVEYSRIKSLGMPIFDYFKNSDGKSNLSRVLNIDIKKYNKIIMYMPTFRQGFNHNDINNLTDNIFNIKNDYDDKKLNEFLSKNNYLLCIKPHPGELSKSQIIETDNIKMVSEEEMIKNQVSVNEIMNAFDLLITDYSSIGTEFIFLDKPVLFNVSDIEEYTKNRGLLFGSDNFWFPGPTFKTMEDLIKESEKLLSNSSYFKKERAEKKKLWFGTLNSGGCEQICNFLFENFNISTNVKKYKSELLELRNRSNSQAEIIKDQVETIKKLTESDIRLKEIENSKSWKMLEKIRKLRK